MQYIHTVQSGVSHSLVPRPLLCMGMRLDQSGSELMAALALVPALVIVLCGKRKSGKDYVAARLQEM